MELIVGSLFFLTLLLFLRISKLNRKSELNPWLLPAAFIFKIAVGLLFLQFYVFQHSEPHLKTDAGAFINEAKILNSVYDQSPSDYLKLLSGIGSSDELSTKYLGATNHWDSGSQAIFSDNRNIIRVHAMIDLFSFGIVSIHMLIFAFISLIGTLLLFLSIKRRSSLKPWVIFGLLLLLPNILFWSSGILKETFVIFGIGAFAYGLMNSKSWIKKITFIGIGIISLICFKPYILLVGIPSLVVYWIYVKSPRYKLALSFGIPLLISTLILVCVPSILEKGTHLLSRKQFDFANVGRGGTHVDADTCFYYFAPSQRTFLRMEGDSVWLKNEIDAFKVMHGDLTAPAPIHLHPNKKAWMLYFDQPPAASFIKITPIDDKAINLLTTAPAAIFSAIFRPLPSDPGGNLKHLAFVETLLLFSLVLWTILRHKPLSVEDKGFILGSIVFCLLLALLIGWTTPVLGAVHRYRLPIQLAMICCIIVSWKPNIRILRND